MSSARCAEADPPAPIPRGRRFKVIPHDGELAFSCPCGLGGAPRSAMGGGGRGGQGDEGRGAVGPPIPFSSRSAQHARRRALLRAPRRARARSTIRRLRRARPAPPPAPRGRRRAARPSPAEARGRALHGAETIALRAMCAAQAPLGTIRGAPAEVSPRGQWLTGERPELRGGRGSL